MQKVHYALLEAQTEKLLISRIESKIKEFDTKAVEKLMRGVKAKLKSIGKDGKMGFFII